MSFTKAEILALIKDSTANTHFEYTNNFTANRVSNDISISRSLASQYLNELFREGHLVKVNTRPVLFYHKDLLKTKYKSEFNTCEYYSVDDLRRVLYSVANGGDFSEVIGYNGSLKNIINQSIANLKSPNRKPMILVGAKATGKKTLSQGIYNYVVKEKLLSLDSALLKIDFVDGQLEIADVINQMRENPARFYSISGVNSLSENDQLILKQKLKTFSNENTFICLCFDDYVNKEIWNSYLILELRDFDKRNLVEKKELAFYFFKEESNHVGKELYIKESLLNILSQLSYEDNLLGLKTIVKAICEKVFTKTDENQKNQVFIFHLRDLVSDDIINQHFIEFEKERYIKASDYNYFENRFKDFYSTIINNLGDIEIHLSEYANYILKGLSYDKTKIELYQDRISKFLEIKSIDETDQVISDQLRLVSLMISNYENYGSYIDEWILENKHTLASILSMLENLYSITYESIIDLNTSLYNFTGYKINEMDLLVLFFIYIGSNHYDETLVNLFDHGRYNDLLISENIKTRAKFLTPDDFIQDETHPGYYNVKGRTSSNHFDLLFKITSYNYGNNSLFIANDTQGNLLIDLIATE